MAKITRAVQKLFASTAGAQQISQFGSLANSTPMFTTDPVTIQGLSEFLNGWFDAILGDSNPAIEDMNALFFLAFYQIAYGFQQGIAEWDSGTTYYIGSIVQDGSGVTYLSTADNNLNNAVNTANWFPIGTVGALNQVVGNVTLQAGLRITTPSPITVAAASTMSVPSTTLVIVPESVTVPSGATLTVAPGGTVRVV